MAPRALRKLQREQELQRQLDAAKKAYEEAEQSHEEDEEEEGDNDLPEDRSTSSQPKNVFDMLEDAEEDAADDSDIDEGVSNPSVAIAKAEEAENSTPSIRNNKKKKKKQKKKGKNKVPAVSEPPADSGDEVDRALRALAVKDGLSGTSSPQPQMQNSWESSATKLLAIQTQNLNPVNEMRSLFGNIALEGDSRSGTRPQRHREVNQQGGVDLETALTGRYCVASRGKELGNLAHRRNVFVQGKEDWPLATSGGLSMEAVTDDSGDKQYNIMHNDNYRESQINFRMAVESMDPQRMIGLLSLYPYHVATLLQVSEIAKHQGDHAVSGDLVERALFSFGKSVQSSFPTAMRSGTARVPFNKPANRELYLTIWRYIRNLEMRGTWRTAFEWAKMLLQLNPLTDPYGVTLMIDQLALRGRQPTQLIDLCSDEAYGEAWDFLPNIQISLALAYLRAGRPRDARSRLAVAMHKYPYIISALASALDISPLPKYLWAKLPSTDAEKLYTELYVHRAKDLWNTPETISLVGEVAETLHHYKEAISAAADAPKLEISLEEARHIMLLEVPALIALLPRKFTNMPTSSSDVLPPPDSQSDFIARAPGSAPSNGLDTTVQTIFNAAGATAGGAGTLLTRIMNWFQTPVTAGEPSAGEAQANADLQALQEQLGGNLPPEMIEELLQMQMDNPMAHDLGEGVTAGGLGLAGGWDYYEEADREDSNQDEDHSSMPELESTPGLEDDEPVPLQRVNHAATVEDAAEEDGQDGEPRRGPSSSGAILRHVDSDEEDNRQAIPSSARRHPAAASPRITSPQVSGSPVSSELPDAAVSDRRQADTNDPQRLQRWLLTTGLTDLQANPRSNLASYVEKIRHLPPNQRDWTIRIVGQRAGAAMAKEIREAMV
jgi:tetratricopeptide (TPR) repeat protein